MSRVNLDHFEPLIAKALTDPQFRTRLTGSAESAIAAAKSEGIMLDAEDAVKLARLNESLNRFGAVQGLHAEDVRNWTIGALLSAAKKDWPLNIIAWRMDEAPRP